MSAPHNNKLQNLISFSVQPMEIDVPSIAETMEQMLAGNVYCHPMISVSVEILQNIMKHGTGMSYFKVHVSEENFLIQSGNHVATSISGSHHGNIEHVKSVDFTHINDACRNALCMNKSMGLLQIKRTTENRLFIALKEYADISYFIITCLIRKTKKNEKKIVTYS
jgi:hypothetical protein